MPEVLLNFVQIYCTLALRPVSLPTLPPRPSLSQLYLPRELPSQLPWPLDVTRSLDRTVSYISSYLGGGLRWARRR